MNVFAQSKNAEILIICKKNNSDAPFQFKFLHAKITVVDRSEMTDTALLLKCKTFAADYIFLAGWVYKPYLKLLKELENRNCVLGLDNKWTGSLKQNLGTLYFRIFLKRYIKSVFVPGPQQNLFARKLGFTKEQIAEGAYCCDFEMFHGSYLQNKENKKVNFPKRFLFVGRYSKEKGIEELWSSFIQLQDESPSDWELWCLGKGDVKAVVHPKIKHFGFLQPEEMSDIIEKTGVFVLPSTFEPWGVVVHEYAAAGFPLLCSNEVGAASVFLKEHENGYSFKAGDSRELKSALDKFTKMNNETLNIMSEKSAKIGSTITPEIWVNNLLRLYGYSAN